MGAKYNLLKITTIAGTIFSVYSAFSDTLLLEDLLLVILIAATLVEVSNGMKAKHAANIGIQEAVEKTIEETIAKQIATR